MVRRLIIASCCFNSVFLLYNRHIKDNLSILSLVTRKQKPHVVIHRHLMFTGVLASLLKHTQNTDSEKLLLVLAMLRPYFRYAHNNCWTIADTITEELTGLSCPRKNNTHGYLWMVKTIFATHCRSGIEQIDSNSFLPSNQSTLILLNGFSLLSCFCWKYLRFSTSMMIK